MMNRLTTNVTDIVSQAIEATPSTPALIVFDTDSELSQLLSDAYKAALPHAQCVDFNVSTPEEIFAAIDALTPGSLVVLIQSTSFRLNKFRFRLHLFNLGMAVIEHPHLGRIPKEELSTYVDALAYPKDYYRTLGPALKKRIDTAKQIVVHCGDLQLVYDGPFEEGKLNIGDYRTMKNTGGQFPIGEVFTEPADLTRVNGAVSLFAFGNEHARTVISDPFTVQIQDGKIVDAQEAPDSFKRIMEIVQEDEPLWIRELGFGLNRALTRTQTLHDVGSYERMCGVHLSIGKKHTIYKKDGFPKRQSKYHVDVFADVTRVTIDGETVFEGGTYTL